MTLVGLALLLGTTCGFGLWLMVSRIPVLQRPRLLYRVAPYVLDVSADARDLVSRKRVDPANVLGVVATPLTGFVRPIAESVFGSREVLERRLLQARSDLDASGFRRKQLLWAVIGAVGGAALGVVLIVRGANAVVPVALIPLGAVLASSIADYLLGRAARARLARIASELPTVLELLALSLAAGEGLSDALRRVARVSNGELAHEIRIAVAESAAGESLPAALEHMAANLSHAPVTRFVDQLRGAIERGTPLAQTLQAQAGDVRDESKRQLMETAGKKEIVMLVPLVFGVLPVTVCFALWPGLYVLQVGF